MNPVTYEDKKRLIESRERKKGTIGNAVDTALRTSEAHEAARESCGGGACPGFSRAFARILGVRRRDQGVGGLVAALDAKAGCKAGTASKSRLEDTRGKLEQHRNKLLARRDALEQEARAQLAAGRKQEALRCLRRKKALDTQVASTSEVLCALEMQGDVIEQASLQRDVVMALGASAKTLQKDKKLLSKAESAVDASVEMKDLADGLQDIMAEFASPMTAGSYDDDELLAELEELQSVSAAAAASPAEGGGGVRKTAAPRPASEPAREKVNLPSAPTYRPQLSGAEA